jgi:hypothetical protein
MCASTLLASLSIQAVDGSWVTIAKLQWVLVFGAGWFLIARMKCQACGARLPRDFPVGSLLALPFSVQPCKRCGKRL